jgi:hypothetical protein
MRLVMLIAAALVAQAAAAETITFSEYQPGTSLVDPLPSNAFGAFGLTITGTYWGIDRRDPFGSGQAAISPIFAGPGAVITFAQPVDTVELQFWTVSNDWNFFAEFLDASHSVLGSFASRGTWDSGGGSRTFSARGIAIMRFSCQEAATGLEYPCGAVALSTLTYNTPATQLAALLAEVTGVGAGTSLADMVKLAQTYYSANDIPNTCSQLTALVSAVNAQKGKKISQSLATQILSDTRAIQTGIGCGPG